MTRHLSISSLLSLAVLTIPALTLRAETVVPSRADGFELHNSGLVYWRRGNCDDEFSGPGRVSYVPGPGNGIENALEACSVLDTSHGTAAAAGALLYFFNNQRLSSLPWSGDGPPVVVESSSGAPLSELPVNFPAMVARADTVDAAWYWAEPSSGGRSLIRRARLVTPPFRAEDVYLVPGLIERLVPYRFTNAAGTPLEAIAALTTTGELWTYVIGARFGLLLESGVTDVHIRVVPRTNGSIVATIYAAKGLRAPSGSAPPPGSVVRIDALSRQSVFAFQCQGTDQALAVTSDRPKVLTAGQIDRGNLYVTIGRVSCGGTIFQTCSVTGTTIQRSTLPGQATSSWAVIAAGSRAVGRNLRSDGEWVYFLDDPERRGISTSIGRVAADASPLIFDLRADEVEVTQGIQNLAGEVPLIAGREDTFVRGFARFHSNRGEASIRVTAQIRAWVNGQELAGSPFPALKSPRLRQSVDLAPRRDDGMKSYLFRLPPLPAGTLRVEFLLDPNEAYLEIGGNGPVDTRITRELTVIDGGSPCLTFIFPRLRGLAYSFLYPGVNNVLDRAKSLLPVRELDINSHGVDLSDDVRSAFSAIDVDGDEDAACDQTRVAYTKLINELALVRECSWSPPSWCVDEYWIAAIQQAVPVLCWTGQSNGKRVVTVRMNDQLSSAGVPWRYPRAGVTLAHELGHEYGRAHVACGFPERPDLAYPYGGCIIGHLLSDGYYGFDPITRSVVHPRDAGDLMSYAGDTWTSDYTWRAILAESRSRGGIALRIAGDEEEYLLVQGSVDLAGPSGALETMYTFLSEAVDPVRIADSLGDARKAALDPALAAQLVLLGSNRQVLGQSDLLLRQDSDGEDRLTSFLQYVPFDASARSIELRRDGRTLATRTLSLAAPRVVLDDVTVDAGALRPSWRADDADGDALLFNVYYSADDGASWRALVVGHVGHAYAVSTRDLAGSTRARLRVDASDGVRTTSVVSDAFEIAEHRPEVLIGGVDEGASIDFGSRSTLRAIVIDPDLRSRPFSTSWQLVGPVRRDAVGSSLSIDSIPPGDYVATAIVTDASGRSGTAERSFEVAPLLVVASSALTGFDGRASDPSYDEAPLVSLGVGGEALAWITRTEDSLLVAASGLPYAAVGPAASLSLLVDADASGETSVRPGDFGVRIASDGSLTALRPDRGALVDDPSPNPLIDAVVARGPSSWSVEIRIPAAMLGNWSHRSRLALWIRERRQSLWPESASSTQPSTWALVAYADDATSRPNRPPVANAGADDVVHAIETVLVPLDGAGSSDADGDTLTHEWTQLSGPTVSIVDANLAQARVSLASRSTPTLYRFRLTVRDAATEASDEMSVLVVPVPRVSRPIDGGDGPGFVRGDVDVSGGIDISDAVAIFNWLFVGGGEPRCVRSADTNDDANVDITDGVYVLGFLFLGGAEPPAPFPSCGTDSTPDGLSCASFSICP